MSPVIGRRFVVHVCGPALEREAAVARLRGCPDLTLSADGAEVILLAASGDWLPQAESLLGGDRRPVVIVAEVGDVQEVLGAALLGARAFVDPDDGADAMVEGLCRAAAGEPYLSPRFRRWCDTFPQPAREPWGLRQTALLDTLTLREQEVVLHLLGFLEPEEIAALMSIDGETVHTHFTNVCQKLHVERREGLYRLFFRPATPRTIGRSDRGRSAGR